ncbi:MAG: hypothetical protein SOI44_08210 [Lactimicrobium sp.]|jgi:flagellar biosynthesis GTPase FlhF|uniref:hypothetical protein n=1 Tax=Lactimicrobium sp. TaxID=2563780 RepID=UPI002F358658
MMDEDNKEEMNKEEDSASKAADSADTKENTAAETKPETDETVNPETEKPEEENTASETDEKPAVAEAQNTKEETEEKPAEETKETETAKAETESKKKGVPLWAAIVVIVACVGVLAMVLRQNGSLIMDPEDWGIGGRRSYIYVQLKTPSQADKSANFTFAVPDSINGVSNKEYWIVKDYIYDVRYTDDDGTVEYILHKCERNDLETADTNTYRQSNIVDVNGIEVTEKGQDDLVQSATWSSHGYYYQILTREDNKLDADTIAALIPEIG